MSTIDLSKKNLKKIQITDLSNTNSVDSLILDGNELSSFEDIGSFHNLLQLSASRNRIRRISTLPLLSNLCALDLSYNSIVCIEGLKGLRALKHLNLAGNYIKIIDHLNHNLELQTLNLSENAIGHVNDISYLTQLQELYLHKNHISHLRQCEKYLPRSLELLTLSDNRIAEIAEVSHLEKLENLRKLSFTGNPCLQSPNGKTEYNYRPYLKMWCLNLTVVDDTPLDPIESLKAEWLYSQGRGRRFRSGDQDSVTQFLASTCPLTPKTPSAEEEKKLLLILSKAEQYKQQLRDQVNGRGDSNRSRMVSSYHDSVGRRSPRASPEIMSRSFDCTVLRTSPPLSQRSSYSSARSGTPLQAASTLVPVPESLISPDVCRPLHPLLTQSANRNGRSPLATPPPLKPPASPHSTPESRRRYSPSNSPKTTPTKLGNKRPASENMSNSVKHEVPARKLQNIQMKASQKRQKSSGGTPSRSIHTDGKENKPNLDIDRSSDVWLAATCIQRRWRGYRARSKNTKVYKEIQASRLQEYIMKVSDDMEATKAALEGNRKLQVLQMKAIDAVWQKLEGSDVTGLAASCLSLSRQVEELRGLVQQLQTSNSGNSSPPVVPISTQTDITAVTTPQGYAVFPYPNTRPEVLNINDNNDVLDAPVRDGRGEEVCLTPSCQEGRDLQALDSSSSGGPNL